MTGTRFDQHTDKESRKNKSIISGELANRIAQGDTNAGNEFVKINYNWLLRIIRRKFPQSNNQEDIVQDAFMLTINKLQKGSIKNPLAILGFIRTTAINIGYEYLRKDNKYCAVEPKHLTEIIDDKDDIISQIYWNKKNKYVKLVMKKLKKKRDRNILDLYYFKDMEKKLILDLLNLSSTHFDRVIHRAKKRLKKLLENDGDSTSAFIDQKNSQKMSKESKDFGVSESDDIKKSINFLLKFRVQISSIVLLISRSFRRLA